MIKKTILLLMLLLLPCLVFADNLTNETETNSTIVINETIIIGSNINESELYHYIEYLINSTYVDREDLELMYSGEIDQAMADQQSFFLNTVMPQIEQFTQLQSDLDYFKKDNDRLEEVIDDLQDAFTRLNNSETKYSAQLERENNIYSYMFGLLGVFVFLAMILYIYKQRNNGGSAKWHPK